MGCADRRSYSSDSRSTSFYIAGAQSGVSLDQLDPLKPAGPRSTSESNLIEGPWQGGGCEQCGEPFALGSRGKQKRFCSEACRKQAEAKRRNNRKRAGSA